MLERSLGARPGAGYETTRHKCHGLEHVHSAESIFTRDSAAISFDEFVGIIQQTGQRQHGAFAWMSDAAAARTTAVHGLDSLHVPLRE